MILLLTILLLTKDYTVGFFIELGIVFSLFWSKQSFEISLQKLLNWGTLDPTTNECFGLNRLTSSGSPAFVVQRPPLTSMAMQLRYD